MIRTFHSFVALLLLLTPVSVLARSGCEIVDLMPAFEAVLKSSGSIDQYRKTLTDGHPEIYNRDYVNALLKPDFTESEAKSLTWARDHLAEVEASHQMLLKEVPGRLSRFGELFPRFQCNFTFYIAPSFGHMDGSAATINGRPMMVFSPDVIPRLHEPKIVRVLIDHETFHVYHSQVSHGAFGSFGVGVPKTYQSLWSEGLAVYTSWQLSPTASLDDALLDPNLRAAASPNTKSLASALRDHLDDDDPDFFAKYFTGGSHPPSGPSRSGYYIGLLVARELAMRYPLSTLAELDDARVRKLLGQQLDTLSPRTTIKVH